jgi:hypothetical protein
MKNFLDLVNNQEKKVIAIDFDGVIHKNSKGFYDGTIYDDPLDGSIDAIKNLSENYEIVIFSCKALPDRPLIENKTGITLIQEWLKKHGIFQCVKDVTWEKPRAFLYIDDKGYRFENWKDTIGFIKNLKGI